MIPLSQYIEERIYALNQLDGEIQRMRTLAERSKPEQVAAQQQQVIDQLQAARDASDRKLFDLYILRSALWATPDVIAPAEEAWKELCTAWASAIALGEEFATGAALRIGYLLNAENHERP